MNRRRMLSLALGGAGTLWMMPAAWAQAVNPAEILHDPDTPGGGNPKGDVTIVAFLDYNCPYCKKSDPALEEVVRADGKVRLVYKDLPILTPASVYGARLALAAKYQGKYRAAHGALMALPGAGVTEAAMLAAVTGSGVDMARLQQDLAAHDGDITAQLKRNVAQAKSLGLQGTPVYLVGPYLVAAALDADGFREVVADARARKGQ